MNKTCKQCNVEMEEGTKFCPQCCSNQEKNEEMMLSNSHEFLPTIEVLRESSFVGCLLSYTIFVEELKLGKLKMVKRNNFNLSQGYTKFT